MSKRFIVLVQCLLLILVAMNGMAQSKEPLDSLNASRMPAGKITNLLF
jgi:hypothetical protein